MRTVSGHLGSVSFDGATVRIQKKLRGEESIPLVHITSVGIMNAGIGMRAIRFSVAGGSSAASSVALGSHKDFANDPYALTFRKSRLSEFEVLASEIEAARVAS